MPLVVHTYSSPTGARLMAYPMIERLEQAGIRCELWVDGAASQPVPAGIVVVEQPCQLIANPLRLVRRFFEMFRRLRRTSPLALHAHQFRSACIPLAAAWFARIPLRIYHNHGLAYLGYRGPLRWLMALIERVNIDLATHVVMVSTSNRDAAIASGLLRKGSGTVLADGSAIGIDLTVYNDELSSESRQIQARQRLGIPYKVFVLGFIGRPVARKGFHMLLNAWRQSGLASTGAVLVIAGSTQAEVEVLSGGPTPGVRCLGFIDAMPDFHAAVDAVALPSWHEGFGYALLEAAATGRPSIGTDIPGIRCAVVNGSTGLLVQLHDDEGLSNAIRLLASDPELRQRLGRAGRERVVKNFRREQVLDALVDFYHQLGINAARTR